MFLEMQKKRIVRNMEDIASDVMDLIIKRYPDGWRNHVIKVPKPNGDFFHAITVDTEDVSYLIKVKVKVESKADLEKEEQEKEKREAMASEKEPSQEQFNEEQDYNR